MLFRPVTVACLWDTWLFYEQGIHYLFYLFNSRPDAYWDGLGVATSADGVHFTDHGPILRKADDAKWLGTGMTWKVGDRYLLNFSENRGDRQAIYFAESTDLLHWQRLPEDEYVCRMDPRWYADAPALSPHRWDCIWVLPRENGPGYVGFLTAVGRDGPRGLCGTAGFVLSDDGLHFRAEPPVVEQGTWADGVEVGAVEKLDGRYYMLLGVFQMALGARHLSRLPAGQCGMFVLSSETQAGPYRLDPRQPLLLGSSPTPFTYFARFYRLGDELLVNHHTVARSTPMVGHNAGPDVSFAPLKRACVDPNGLLGLRWWPGNEALRGHQRPVHLDECAYSSGVSPEGTRCGDGRLVLTAPAHGIAFLPAHYNLELGLILEAKLTLEAASGPLASLGLFFEGDPHGTGSMALAQSDGRLMVGPFNGYAFRPEDGNTWELQPGCPAHWRILLRGSFLEIYIDEMHVKSYTLPHAPNGRLGLVVEAGRASFGPVRAWEMAL